MRGKSSRVINLRWSQCPLLGGHFYFNSEKICENILYNYMESKLISIGKASELLGVCIATLRLWHRAGKLIPVKTLGGHRRYKLSDIKALQEGHGKK